MAREGLRRSAGCWLVVALVATVFAASATGSFAAGRVAESGSLTIHARTCPASYVANAHFEDCHDDPMAGIGYAVAGPLTVRAETDTAGNAVAAGLPPGAYTIVDEGDIPFEFIDRLDVFCAERGTPGTAFPFAPTERGARVAIGSGQHVVCDFYYVGADLRGFPTATLTIHNRLCPPGFAGRDFYGACHDSPAPAGLGFAVEGPDSGSASTDEHGNTAFRLAAGRYAVRGGVPGEFATLAVFCARSATPGVAFPITAILGGTRGPTDLIGIEIDLGGGDDVVCDWYNTPEGGR